MATAAPRPEPGDARPALSRERIVQTAVSLADRDGLTSITMRKLGEELGVEAMSLYNHVRNKSDLLDGMVDAVFDEIELPTDPSTPWFDALRTRCASARQVLRAHPWAVGLTDSRTSPGTATLGHHDAVLGVLLSAGFSLPMAGHAFATLDSYTYGFALQESALPVSEPDETAELAAELLAGTAAEQFPNLARFTTGHVLREGYAFADEFDWGLDIVIEGIRRRWEAESSSE